MFIYRTFEFKNFLHHKVYKFRTETLEVMFPYVYISGFRVEFRSLDLSFCACFGELLKPSA